MKTLVIVVSLVAYVSAGVIGKTVPKYNSAYGYLTKYGIPEAERIQIAEDEHLRNKPLRPRIIGGLPASSGQFKYQAGLISDVVGTSSKAVCGGSLITPNRVLTAAHCWFDGINQAWRFTVVLGTELLFTGGTRIQTSDVTVHPNWIPFLVINDIAIIRLTEPVTLSEYQPCNRVNNQQFVTLYFYLMAVLSTFWFIDTIGIVSLPTGSEVFENFNGQLATAVGFGNTHNDSNITGDQFLSYVNMKIISNELCNIIFFGNIRESNICTSTFGKKSTCRGDSGGPLVVQKNDRTVLIGITSFGIDIGCDIGWPVAFTRVTSFLGFIYNNI